jgi:hypothetical protein
MVCILALDVRRQVWETSKFLMNALEHVEDIEDEDEPRILRERMDALRAHIKDALKSKWTKMTLLCFGSLHR